MHIHYRSNQLNSFTDAQIDAYLAENGRMIMTEDPENLSAEFMQRLGARGGSMPSDKHRSVEDLAAEREAHDRLVADGGRPWYPIEMLEYMTRKQLAHYDTFSYWRGVPGANEDAWKIFSYQEVRWKKFLAWQKRVRKDYKDAFYKYRQWTDIQLLKNDFKRSVDFKQDAKEQDQITTWIEYLVYEFREYDRWSNYKHRLLWFDKKCEELVAANVLEPGETPKSIIGFHPLNDLEKKKEHLQDELQRAEAAVRLAEDTCKESLSPSPEAQKTLDIAMKNLKSTTREHKKFTRRYEHITKFRDETDNFRSSKQYGSNHEKLLQWIQHQIPEIEAEMKAKAAAAKKALDNRISDTGVMPYQPSNRYTKEFPIPRKAKYEQAIEEVIVSKRKSRPFHLPSKRKYKHKAEEEEEDELARDEKGYRKEVQLRKKLKRGSKGGGKKKAKTRAENSVTFKAILPRKKRENGVREQFQLRRSPRIAALRAKALALQEAMESRRETRQVLLSNMKQMRAESKRVKRRVKFVDEEDEDEGEGDARAVSDRASKRRRR